MERDVKRRGETHQLRETDTDPQRSQGKLKETERREGGRGKRGREKKRERERAREKERNRQGEKLVGL